MDEPKLDRVEGQKDGKAEKVATVETDGLGCTSVRQVIVGQQGERPTVDRDILCGGEEDEGDKDKR